MSSICTASLPRHPQDYVLPAGFQSSLDSKNPSTPNMPPSSEERRHKQLNNDDEERSRSPQDSESRTIDHDIEDVPSKASSSSNGRSYHYQHQPCQNDVSYATKSSIFTSVEQMGSTGLWVFGYGSLCWHQGFDFSDSMTGYVKGYARRFWQGNVTHRGTDKKPGRVATLVEDKEDIVWGQAFQVRGEAALPYLNNRECDLGGYRTTLSMFYPRDRGPPFPALLYVATPSNKHWLGEDQLPSIADQIIECEGASGHNVEYLLRLADFVRETVPEAADEHLFGLEKLVKERVMSRKLCLRKLMGEHPDRAPVALVADDQPHAAVMPNNSTAQFSNRVPSKKLRCVNI